MSLPRSLTAPSLAFVNVAVVLVLSMLLGGSSRPDIATLPLLRFVAVLATFYGLWSLRRVDVTAHWFLLGMAGAIVALIVLHLIPLPPSLWGALPGRDILREIDDAANLGGTWRPLSMAPDFTWNALFALSVPLAVLLNGLRLDATEHRRLMIVVLIGAGLSMLLGLLQIASATDALYLYRRSFVGTPSGLFANRNHQALFLATLLPLFAFLFGDRVWGRRPTAVVRFVSVAGTLIAIAFIVVLGSRAGLVTGVLGLIGAGSIIVLLWPRDLGATSRLRLWAAAAVLLTVALIIGWALFAGTADTISRISTAGEGEGEELRFVIWPIIARSFPIYMPWGTGVGAYERVFRVIEPDTILRPTYSNHAHNDWLEVAWTAGIPGVLLLVVAVLAFCVTIRRVLLLRGAARAVAWLGLVSVALGAIGSLVDYPLRTPFLSALFALSCVWVAAGLRVDWTVSRGESRQLGRREGRARQ
ncbi:O-antigen ligase family protein [Sphingomonas sp. BK235]|uniref:O-antigen ligase family protein n=1 Tax=Sphingomonas sp. BK235 TaxID=2512131 RepID=UPI0010EF8B61|nr:O-antigen ligase family protein [Sphingomonas sp. BK235]TCP29366.1 O-antigen ligase-like membrane protein [Sphingomonas sp. BK235]